MPEIGSPGRRLLMGVSASASVVNVPAYLLALRARFAPEVRVVLTRSAARIMPAQTLRLFASEVIEDDAQDSYTDGGHVADAHWASHFIMLPATANLLGTVACGLAPTYLTSVALAYEGPIIFFPNMNRSMWSQRSVQRNVQVLRADGHVVVDPQPVAGYEVAVRGAGAISALPPPATIIRIIERHAGASMADHPSCGTGRETSSA